MRLGLGLGLNYGGGGNGQGSLVRSITGKQPIGVQIAARAYAPIIGEQSVAVVIGAEAADVTAPPEYISTTTVFNTSGTTRTPPALTYSAGDILIARGLSRVTGTNTISAPAGEGWAAPTAALEEGSVTSAIWVKRIGDGGQVDDSTPTFTNTTGGTWGMEFTVVRGGVAAGTPYSQTTVWTTRAAAATLTSPLVASPPAASTLTFYFFNSTDDNALNANTRGTSALSGTAGNVGATGCMATIYEQSVDSSALDCTVTESANGNDTGKVLTLVIAAT